MICDSSVVYGRATRDAWFALLTSSIAFDTIYSRLIFFLQLNLAEVGLKQAREGNAKMTKGTNFRTFFPICSRAVFLFQKKENLLAGYDIGCG